jgi:hypothetical protein
MSGPHIAKRLTKGNGATNATAVHMAARRGFMKFGDSAIVASNDTG